MLNCTRPKRPSLKNRSRQARNEISPYIDLNKVQTLLAAKSWDGLEDVLEEVCQWELGCRVFGFAGQTPTHKRVTKAINDALDTVVLSYIALQVGAFNSAHVYSSTSWGL